jgi:hypothetical protein
LATRRLASQQDPPRTFGWLMLATKDLDGTFQRLHA